MTPEKSSPGRGRGGGGRRGPRRRVGAGGGRGGGGGTTRAPIEPLHPSDQPPDIASFHEWALGPVVLGVLDAMGISNPTPIQRLAIQPVLDGRDVIAKAETGTGKTLAFGAPMMAKIDPGRSTVLGLVLCPTRELAQQVASVLEQLGRPNGTRVALIVGGEGMHAQIDALKRGAQVVVGTPGRVLDLYGQGFLSFPWTEFVVLDEADEMLEIGFIDDVKKILSYTPDERQTLHFSATFPHDVLALARESTRNPVEIATAAGVSTVKTIEQSFLEVSDADRPLVLRRLIERSDEDDVFLIFCDRRTEVDQLFRTMERSRIPVKALHGGYDQASRFRVMSAFRDGDVKALLATDVASRGLDVDHVTWVVNYSVPRDLETYTHRIGRTGRAGRKGRAITLVTRDKARRWSDITRRAPWEIPEADLGGRERRERAAEPPRPERAARRDRNGRDEPRRDEPRRQRAGRGRTRERGAGTEGTEHGRSESAARGRGRGPRGEPQDDRRPRESRPTRDDEPEERLSPERFPEEPFKERPESGTRRSEDPSREGRRRAASDRSRSERPESEGREPREPSQPSQPSKRPRRSERSGRSEPREPAGERDESERPRRRARGEDRPGAGPGRSRRAARERAANEPEPSRTRSERPRSAPSSPPPQPPARRGSSGERDGGFGAGL